MGAISVLIGVLIIVVVGAICFWVIENDPACGRGWAMLGTAGRLVGHFYIHNGDDSGFVCERG